MNNFKKLSCIIVITLCVSCVSSTYLLDSYGLSRENVTILKEYNKVYIGKINLASVTSNFPRSKILRCKFKGEFGFKKNSTVEAYIEEAINNELEYSGIFSISNAVEMQIHIIDLYSIIEEQLLTWGIVIQLTIGDEIVFFTSEYTKKIDNLTGDEDCLQTMLAFEPAVGHFIGDLYKQSLFKKYVM